MNFFSFTGKKCTYGIKCKFYHPERANQSLRSLADELRDNARLSNPVHSCPENGGALGASPRGSYFVSSLQQDLENKLTLDSTGSSLRSQYSNGMLPYWDDINCSGNHASNVANHTPLKWQFPFLPNPPSSGFSSDSGLGSFESQFSEASRGLEDLYRVSSKHPGPSYERQDASGPCSCSSDSTGRGGHQQFCRLAKSPSNFLGYGTAPYPRPNHGCSMPNGWSDPYWPLQPRIAFSLPDPVCNASLQRAADVYECNQYMVSSQAEREEVRKKLYAIFNPYHVDKVMGMFPKLKDAQQLAAEILKLKSKGDML